MNAARGIYRAPRFGLEREYMARSARDPSENRKTPQEVKGTPTPIPPGDNSIVCKAGVLVVQNNNTGPDSACTQAHENSHIADWKKRYGKDLCKGVDDGYLPVGGDGYKEFLRQSECKGYKIGKECREKLLKTAADKDKPAIQAGIDRDNEALTENNCP